MTSDERGRLSAIGSTNIEIYTESIGRAVVAVLVGVLAGIVLATLTSPLYPIGFSRRLEPSAGVRVDVTTLALGALILVVGLLGWITLSLRVRST